MTQQHPPSCRTTINIVINLRPQSRWNKRTGHGMQPPRSLMVLFCSSPSAGFDDIGEDAVGCVDTVVAGHA